MLGSNTQWLPSDDASFNKMEVTTNNKKKPMDRLSRLFQKTSAKSHTDDILEQQQQQQQQPPLPLQPSISRHSSLYSIRSTQQQTPSSKFTSASKKGGQVLKRLTSLRSNPPWSRTSTEQLQQELCYKQQLLDQLYAEKQQTQDDNQRLAQDLARLEQRTQDRITATAQLHTHLASLRATPDDLDSVRIKLLTLQHNIMALADRLLPHASSSPQHTSKVLAGFWLNLRPSIEPLCPLSPKLIHLLTAKFIMDVLVQNFNLNEIAGCTCSDDYAQIALWFLDHDYQQQPVGVSVPSLSSSSSSVSSSTAAAAAAAQSPQPLSDAMIFSIRLRQHIASTVLSSQQRRHDIKRQLRQVVREHWKYLYGGLAKAYPSIYEHDKIVESDPRRHFGAHIQGLVEQAVALGFAIKGLEMDITATDIQEGTQALDMCLMDDLDGKTSGVIQFCISPPFRLFNQYEPLVKGKVLCFTE